MKTDRDAISAMADQVAASQTGEYSQEFPFASGGEFVDLEKRSRQLLGAVAQQLAAELTRRGIEIGSGDIFYQAKSEQATNTVSIKAVHWSAKQSMQELVTMG